MNLVVHYGDPFYKGKDQTRFVDGCTELIATDTEGRLHWRRRLKNLGHTDWVLLKKEDYPQLNRDLEMYR